ncbi:MAG: hydrolase or metal-binding protein, partial [Acinetobacter sp.]|nr:hydrolase or metal-binding protein [Acinetobacter sp.]
ANEIDEQSKQSGFYQEELDQVARQGYANAKFEMEGEEGLDVGDEFYPEDIKQEKQVYSPAHIQVIQKGLQQSVKAFR